MFRKSSYSNSQGACIEVDDAVEIFIRDSMARRTFVLMVSRAAFRELVARVKKG